MAKNKGGFIDATHANPLLEWLSAMIQMVDKEQIKIPSGYRAQVIEVKESLENDISGLVNTLLDFAIKSALVNYSIETPNKALTKKLNNWLVNINSDLRGEIPVGIKALAKEYFKERWKGSSFMLLRTMWETKDGLKVPTTCYFVDGEDIVVKEKETTSLERKSYCLRITDEKIKPIGVSKNEILFSQRPYSSWGADYTTPYLIQKGIWKNLKFLELLEEKGEMVVAKALELISLLKKGDAQSAMNQNPDFIYSKEDLQKVKDDFSKFAENRKTNKGLSTYVTNFDTDYEHIIPDYKKALHQELYAPIERRLLAGLGMVEVVQGIGSTRKEATLNPKPFFGEVESGIEDFKMLISDLVNEIVEQNKDAHRKYFSSEIKIKSTFVKESLSNDLTIQFRSAYDRGNISKRTYSEILGLDFDLEVERRKQETKEGLDEDMYPPVTQNQEQHLNADNVPVEEPKKDKDKVADKDVLPDRDNKVDKKNFDNAGWEKANKLNIGGVICKKCGYEGDLSEYLDRLINSTKYNQIVSLCPNCNKELLESDVEFSKIFGVPKDPRKTSTKKKK